LNGESLWSRLAGLALIVEGCEYDRLDATFACEFERVTAQVRLVNSLGLGKTPSIEPVRRRFAPPGPRGRERLDSNPRITPANPVRARASC
jgi:hypothetical protein